MSLPVERMNSELRVGGSGMDVEAGRGARGVNRVKRKITFLIGRGAARGAARRP